MRRLTFIPKYGQDNPAYRHGLAGTVTYKIWAGIITRCYNSKIKTYKYYGGRGITVCEEWRNYLNFYNDMGERPIGKQLDRINNNLGYFKENCRWVFPRENHPILKGDFIDTMPGKRFGKWLVIKYVNHKPNHRYYLCRCDCGTELIKCGGDLRNGKSTQCNSCKNISHRNWPLRRKNELK